MPSIKVNGMSCEHCRKSVTEALSKLPGVSDVKVDILAGAASWADANPATPVAVDTVKAEVRLLGFDAP